jgi:hypothetical protein
VLVFGVVEERWFHGQDLLEVKGALIQREVGTDVGVSGLGDRGNRVVGTNLRLDVGELVVGIGLVVAG